MADNVNDSLKNLNNNIKDADANLAKLSKDFNVVFTEAVTRAARDAKVSIDQMFDAIAGRVGASKASKLKLLFDIVDEHGKTATPQTIQQKIDGIVKATPTTNGTKLHIGKDWVDVDTANANLRRYKEQLKLIQDMPAAYDLVNRAVNAIIGEFDKEAAAKQKIIEKNEKILEQEIAIEEKQRSKAAAQQQKQEEKQYKEEQKWYDAKAKADRENERRAGEAKYRQMSKEVAEYGKALQRQIELETKANQIRRDYNKIKSDLQGVSKRSEEYKKGQQVLQQYRQELHNVYQEQKKIDNEYKGTRSAVYNQQRINGLRQEYEQSRRNGRQIKENKSSLESMLPTLRRLASAFGVAFSVQGLVNFGKKLVETRGEFELQQVAMRSILQNKQLADEIWDKTMQAALQSPFTAMQLTKYTKQLAAYRIETDKLFDTTKRLADVSAGLGVDMQRLILAYGQVKAANYLRASEIRQFTEAGVNILGELSTYLSATRGEMISTAQVMDMVQKRMVTFEDVEAIFKRMTDEGGIFYNMQYVQSQTVKGQINKLHDAYDQMLNSIGKGNEGVLKDVVAALNNIVQNWRYWAAAIKSIAFGTIIASLSKLGVTLTGVNVAGIAAGKGMTKLAGGVKALGVALKGNWLTLVIGTVVSLAAELYNLNKRMKDVNAEIDEQNLNLFETKERLEEYQDAIERNNKALEGSTGNEEKLKKKREENAEILAKLKNDYPQLAEGMEMQKNGVIDLTDALKKENEELERQMTLNTLMKQSSIFDENLTKDAQDLSKAYINQQQQIIAARAQARSLMVQLKQRGAEGSNQYDILKQISEINPDDLQKAYERLIELRHLLYNDIFTLNGKQPAPGTYQPLVDYYRNYLRGISDVSGSEENLGKEFNKLGEYVGYELEKGLEEAYKEEIGKSGLSTLQWYSLNVNKVQKDVNDGVVDIYRFLRDSLEKNGQAQGPGMQAFWNNIVKTNYIDPYFKAWKVGMEEVEAGGWRFPMALPTEGGMPNIFAAPKEGGDTSGNIITDDDGSKAKKNASRLISLIREMRAEYDKLSKSAYGYAKSEATVRESYKQSVKEILGKAGITDYDFTTNAGMIAALEMVKTYAQKLGPEAAAEVEKYIGQLKTEMTIGAQVRIREDFVKEIEKSFNDYELTLELDKLNISSEAAKNLFPAFDPQTLGQMQDVMKRFYEDKEEQGLAFDEEDLKEFQKWADKIDAEILKSRKERSKEYSKFLEKEYSERAKVEMQYAKDVAFVTANFSGQQQKNILEGINDKFQKDISELNWKSFKESSFYVEMMDDLSSVPIEYMKIMLSKIEEILKNPEALPPRALKEAINARQKIIEAQMDFDQISVMKESMAEIREAAKDEDVGGKNWRQTKKRLDEEQKAQAEKLAGIEQEIRANEKLQGQLKGLEDRQKAYNDARKGLSSGTISDLGELNDPQSLMNEYEADIAVWQKRVEELKSAEGEATSEMNDEIAKLEERIRLRQIEIGVLEKYKESLRGLGAYESTEEGQAAVQAQGAGQTSTSVGGKITKGKKDAENVSKRLSVLQKWQKAFKNFNDSFAKFNKNAADMVNRLGALSNAAFDLYEALGGETDAMTEAWKDFGGTIVNTITQALEMIPALVAGFVTAGTTINAAMGIIGLIAEAIQLVLVLITGLSKLHDAGYEKEIENQQKKIDELQRAYDRLEKSIEKAFDATSYIKDYNEEVQNLNEQYEALGKQIDAENSKKNVDEDKLQDYKNQQQEILDNLDEIEQKKNEVFGGIDKAGYRDAAQGFVDAWKSAFLETGDGLQGLQDHFDEFLNEWFVKQATMQGVAKYYQKVFDYINGVVEDGSVPTRQDIENARLLADEAALKSDELMQTYASIFGLGGEGALSGLAAGIQGMTEEQANILEAYWNSVRMYTASIDVNVSRIADMLGAGGGIETNPMLAQMRLIAQNTNNISTLLNAAVVKGVHPYGDAFKVVIN